MYSNRLISGSESFTWWLAPSSLPSLPEHPWVPGTFLGPHEAPSLLPACPLSMPGFLEPLWGLRKPLACFPYSLSIPGSLEPFWGLRKPQLAPLTPSLLPCSLSLPEHPWIPGTFLGPQEVPSLLPLLPLPPEHPWVPGTSLRPH